MDDFSKTSRRAFLRGSAAIAAGAVAGKAVAQEGPDPLITDLQDWASYTGVGVDEVPYGLPIKYESDVVRRNVEWLTASPISSINFTPIHALDGTITPQGCAFERHHSGAIELKKEDFEIALYPQDPHSFVHPESWLDEYRRIYKLFEENLK